jgi:hypothetical protein
MKAEPILGELETIKEQLATQAGGDTLLFLGQMEAWLDENPHSGPVVRSPEELQTRLRAREAGAQPLPQTEPYRIHDPIIAGIHRIREQLHREIEASSLILKDEPPRSKV